MLTPRTLLLALLCLAITLSISGRAQAYAVAEVHNHTPYEVRGTIHYVSDFCSNDSYKVKAHSHTKMKSRGACLISKITGVQHGKSKDPGAKKRDVESYHSSGTSYSQFDIRADKGKYRIYSKQEWHSKSVDKYGSPGFKIENKTGWPVAIALSQLGCLYHGVVKPGDSFVRHTGSVWFTIQANVAFEGKDTRTDWDCILPIAEAVGGAILAVATAGIAAGAEEGFAAASTEVAAEAGAEGGADVGGEIVAGGEEADAASDEVVSYSERAKNGMRGFVRGAKKKVASDWKKLAFRGGVVSSGTSNLVRYVNDQTLKKELGEAVHENASTSLAGQYAGYDYPFRCSKMPTYHLTGGPGPITKDKNGVTTVDVGKPMKLKKVNDCGNDMM